MTSGAKNVAVGDINGDRLSDALVTTWSSDALIVLGDETDFRSVRVPLGSVQNPWGVAVADFNEDGKDDFVLADGVGNQATVYLSFDP